MEETRWGGAVYNNPPGLFYAGVIADQMSTRHQTVLYTYIGVPMYVPCSTKEQCGKIRKYV